MDKDNGDCAIKHFYTTIHLKPDNTIKHTLSHWIKWEF